MDHPALNQFSSRVRWMPFFVAPAFIVLVMLGIWQLDRLSSKLELLSEIHTRLSLPPVTLDECVNVDGSTTDLCHHRKVVATGELLSGNILSLLAKTYKKRAGAHILVPLMVEKEVFVLVNLGWVPQDYSLSDFSNYGTATISGVVRIPIKQGWFTPDNDPMENEWYWIDLTEISTAIGVELLPIIIEAQIGPDPYALPIGGQTRVEFPNDHMQYAITWFGMALVLLIGFSLYFRQYLKTRRGQVP